MYPFFIQKNKKDISKINGYTIKYGNIVDGDIIVDEVLVSYFKAPKSYTGEDVVELSCHGGLFILQRVLRAVFNAGAVAAAMAPRMIAEDIGSCSGIIKWRATSTTSTSRVAAQP